MRRAALVFAGDDTEPPRRPSSAITCRIIFLVGFFMRVLYARIGLAATEKFLFLTWMRWLA